MARLRYRAILEPLPRPWFEDSIGLLHDTVAKYLDGPDLSLVEGWALRPGARYATADRSVQVTVESWSRDSETRAELHTDDGGMTTTCLVRLDSASVPRTVGLDGDSRDSEGPDWLSAMTGSLRADLELWWTGLTQPGRQPAIAGWVELPMVHARFAVTPAPDPDGRWRVLVTAKLRGRGLARPLVSAGLLLAQWKLRRVVHGKLDELVRQWNREVPAILARSRDELRELIVAELTKAVS
jgi:hypothetical protein